MNDSTGRPGGAPPALEQAFAQNRDKLSPAASPHLRQKTSVRRIMGDVLIALGPAVLGSVYFFGVRALAVYLASIAAALVCDFALTMYRTKTYKPDGSAVVTGTLLAMSLPVDIPLWAPVLGAAFGILVGKELFGGIGYNFLNPALLGRGLLRVVFPALVVRSPLPAPLFTLGALPDAVAGPTILAAAQQGTALSGADLWNAFTGLVGGKLGETSALLLLIGAAYLFARRVITPRIPVAFFATIALMAFAFAGQGGLFSASPALVLAHLLGGASILGGFYMITDYGSSPTAPAAQLLFGVLCGVGVMLFRLLGGFPEGFTFAVLIANCTVPFMNRFIRPRTLGEGRREAA